MPSCSSAPSNSSDRIPAEFRYWENLPGRKAQRLRWILRILFGTDPVLSDSIVLEYARSYFDADPVAEAVIDELYLPRGQAEGRRLVDRALAQGIASISDAPQSLVRLFAEIETDPPWLDWRQVRLGARVFRRFGTHLHSFAGAITLQGYRENSVAKPLAFTGAYTGETANRRFLETAAFWVDVSEPDGLLPGRPGRATALRVRLMHVFVRRRLLAHPAWELSAWGVPISQGDALLTLMGGSFLPGYGLRVMGYRTSREEIEALMHFWRYVGHLMGVQPRWYPQTIEDALGLMFTASIKGVAGSGEDGVNLAQSYLASYQPRPEDPLLDTLTKWWQYGLQLGYVSWFLPPRTYAFYGLPKPGLWRLHPLLQAPFILALETLRCRWPRLDEWLDARVRRETRRFVEARLGKRHPEYHAVEQFTR